MAELRFITGAPPFPFGSMARHGRGKFVLYRGADAPNLGAHEHKAYLLEIAPFDAAVVKAFAGPPYPFGSVSRRVPRHWTNPGAAETIYPACTGNAERSSENDDVPPAQWVPGKMAGNFNYEISLFNGTDPSSGGGSSVGIIELADPDAELDGLRTLGWDSAPLLLRRGDPAAYFSTYAVVARLLTSGFTSNFRRKAIIIRDPTWRLRQAELHGNRYGGTGGADGDADIKGHIKPIGFGNCFNVTPKLINAQNLVYQVSCTSILAIDAVKDGGVPLVATGDHATYAALEAAVLDLDEFATCLALGLFRTGGKTVSICTADFRGDDDTINGASYPHNRAQIVRRIATGRGNIRLSDPSEVDTQTLRALDLSQPATLGYYFDKEITKADAISQVMAGCAGWWTVRLDGRFAAGQLEDPASSAADFTLAYPTDDATDESRVDEAEMADYVPPRRGTIMGYQRNWTPMDDNQILGDAADDASILKGESSFVTAEDSWVAGAFPSSPMVTVHGGFVLEADAQRECNRQNRLFRTIREPFDIPAAIDPMSDYVGRVVAVTDAERIGLAASRNLFIYGVASNANQKLILRGWG